MLKSIWDHYFKEKIPNLDFLEAVSATVIAKNDKVEMKKSHFPLRLLYLSPSFGFPCWFF